MEMEIFQTTVVTLFFFVCVQELLKGFQVRTVTNNEEMTPEGGGFVLWCFVWCTFKAGSFVVDRCFFREHFKWYWSPYEH